MITLFLPSRFATRITTEVYESPHTRPGSLQIIGFKNAFDGTLLHEKYLNACGGMWSVGGYEHTYISIYLF